MEIPSDQQHLFLKDMELKNNRILGDYDVASDCSLSVHPSGKVGRGNTEVSIDVIRHPY